jgi:hypothetical protein
MPLDSLNMQSEVSRSYNSLSGSDIRAVIGPYQFAELQAVSYSVTREKAPIYTMGSPDPRSFSRNKRGIAGSLVWVNFDRNALLNIMRMARGKFVANRDDVRPAYSTAENEFLSDRAIFEAEASRGNSGIPVGALISDLDKVPLTRVTGFKEMAYAWYVDQIIPFSVTLAGCSELGAATTMKLHGVELLNEGSGISVDDAVTEMQATFVARLIEPWQAVDSEFRHQSFFGGN